MANLKSTTTNRYGMSIVMCCASCQHSGFNNDKTRICCKGEGIVSPKSYCTEWKMRPSLDNAGKGGGRVKKKDWLNHVRSWTPEGGQLSKNALAALKEDWEKSHGSIYIDK